MNIHPHTSTVTYLTSVGAPTLVLDKRCPVEYDAVPEVFGAIPQAWLSYPLARKHMSFDARLLHGAPHVLGPLRGSEERVTFLANIWLNYHPSGLQVHDMRYYVPHVILPHMTCATQHGLHGMRKCLLPCAPNACDIACQLLRPPSYFTDPACSEFSAASPKGHDCVIVGG